MDILSAEEQVWLKEKLGDELCREKLVLVHKYITLWKLWEITLQTSLSHNNLVFSAVSQEHGPVIFKILLNDGFDPEIAAIQAFQEKRFCPLYAFNLQDKVYITKRLVPGSTLFEGTTRTERIGVFAEIYKELHAASTVDHEFPTYLNWIQAGIEGTKYREDCAFLRHHAERAERIVRSLCVRYSKLCLLHGDLHHENILKDDTCGYLVIDPKGVIGDPVFDCSRFILDEFGDDLTSEPQGAIVGFVESLSIQIDIPYKVLLQCLYAETVIWLFREELAGGESLEECAGLIANVETAYAMLLANSLDF